VNKFIYMRLSSGCHLIAQVAIKAVRRDGQSHGDTHLDEDVDTVTVIVKMTQGLRLSVTAATETWNT